MKDNDFLYWLKGVIELKLKFKDNSDLKELLVDINKQLNTKENEHSKTIQESTI